MSLPVQTFVQVSRDAFNRLAASLKADYGLEVTGDQGTVEHSGFQAHYDYQESTKTLIIEVLKKPLFIPSSAVMHGVTEHVSEAMTPKVM